jgi:hypothetical protein
MLTTASKTAAHKKRGTPMNEVAKFDGRWIEKI